MSQNNNFAYHV